LLKKKKIIGDFEIYPLYPVWQMGCRKEFVDFLCVPYFWIFNPFSQTRKFWTGITNYVKKVDSEFDFLWEKN